MDHIYLKCDALPGDVAICGHVNRFVGRLPGQRKCGQCMRMVRRLEAEESRLWGVALGDWADKYMAPL